MYDIVWYSPSRIADAEKVLRRLDLAEAIERGCPDLLLSTPGVDIPGQRTKGRAACRNFLGAHYLASAFGLGSPGVHDLCDLTQHGEGLVGGVLKPEVLLSPEVEEAEQIQAEREARSFIVPPARFGALFRLSLGSLIAAVAYAVAALFSIPRSLKPRPQRKIRSLAELEVEAAMVMGALGGKH